MWVAKATNIFSKNISLYALFNDQSLKATLTRDIISFEQLGPEVKPLSKLSHIEIMKE